MKLFPEQFWIRADLPQACPDLPHACSEWVSKAAELLRLYFLNNDQSCQGGGVYYPWGFSNISALALRLLGQLHIHFATTFIFGRQGGVIVYYGFTNL